MATPGQLVNTIAEVLGIPPATVAQYDRQLAEAGLRTVGGRGRSAAKVTATDAANLLLTILGSPISGPSIAAAKQTCEQVGALPVRPNFANTRKFKRFGLFQLANLPKQHTFREALSALIEGASQGELFRIIDGSDVLLEADFCFGVTVQSDDWAQILADGSIGEGDPRETGRLVYTHRVVKDERRTANSRDLSQERTISFRTLRLLGNLVAVPA